MKYVVSYDNGAGYSEWASNPQPTRKQAIALAGGVLSPGDKVEEIDDDEENFIGPRGEVIQGVKGTWTVRCEGSSSFFASRAAADQHVESIFQELWGRYCQGTNNLPASFEEAVSLLGVQVIAPDGTIVAENAPQ